MRSVCPRCGMEGELVEKVAKRGKYKGRRYYYMVHYLGKDERGRSRLRWCYLGPAEYEYVTKMHDREMLVLRGVVDEDRVLYYLQVAAANAVARVRGCRGLEERLAEVLRMAEEARAALSSAEDPRERTALEKDTEALERERIELEEKLRRCHEARVAVARALAAMLAAARDDPKLAELVARRSGEGVHQLSADMDITA